MASSFRAFSLVAAAAVATTVAWPADGPQPGAAVVYPCVRISALPVIDGRLDEAAWQHAVPVSGFRYSGVSADLVPYQMVMRLCWDGERLYMAVEVEEPNMDKLVITAHGRDAYVFNDDSIEWFFDPQHGHEDFFQFGLNAAGTMWDAHVPNVAWDCDWQAAVAQSPDGWVAEVAVPLKALSPARPRTGTIWGFNLCHQRQAGGRRELINWANVLGNFHRVRLFGHLLFIGDLADLTSAMLRRVAAEVGRPAQVFAPRGWWTVDGRAAFTSYADDLREATTGRIRAMLRRARQLIDRRRHPDLWERCASLRERWHAARREAAAGDVGPLAWAHARIAVEDIERRLPELLWRARLSALLDSL